MFLSVPTTLDRCVPDDRIGSATIVPIRAIAEAIDAQVKWEEGTRTVSITRGDTVIILPIGSTSPTVNGQIVEIDQPATIVSARTLVPLRFIAEAFDMDVRWDGSAKTVTINGSIGLPSKKLE